MFRISTAFLAAVVIAIVVGAFIAADPALYREGLIPFLIDQNLCAQSRSPMDMILQG